jgi:hypothetical protein
MTTIKSIKIRKANKNFHVYGENAGKEGVWLAHGQVNGIYDAPVTSTWKAGAFQEGSSQKSTKYMPRDMLLGFHIVDTTTTWEFNDSEFRLMFDYEPDRWWGADYEPTHIIVETEQSGVRKLEVLMTEAPEFDMPTDPSMQKHGNVIMKLRAGKPFWTTDDYVSEFNGTQASGTGTVTVTNPTDRVAYQKMVLTQGTWVIPDYEFVGPPGQRTIGYQRTVTIPVPAANGGAVVDWDKQELMFRDSNNTNMLGQLAGVFVEFPIPPYTPPTQFPVSYTDAPAGGATCHLRIPQRWSRPWGLELNPVSAPAGATGPAHDPAAGG